MRWVVAIAVVALASGCGSMGLMFDRLLGDKDNTEPPAELVEFEPVIEVKTIWSKGVGAAVGNRYLKLVPTVYEGRVFAGDRKGEVRAYDAESGSQLWDVDTELPISGGAGSGDGLVLFGSQEGDVIALSPDTGDTLWQVRLSSEILAPPRAAEGVVVVRTIDGRLYGLSVDDGSQLWVYDRSIPTLTLRGTSAPALSRGMAIAGFDSGSIVAVSLRDGRLLWESSVAVPSGRTELERLVDIDAEPRILGEAVYVVAFQGRTAALDITSGEVLWQRDMSSYAGISVDRELLFVTDDQSHIWALDRYSSQSMWRQDQLQYRQATAPVGYREYVVVGDFEGYLHWMRREDGQFVGRVRVDSDGIMSTPVVVRDTLFVYGKGGELTALKVD
jgi:outer membrane protein assembly factor BamB